MLTLVTRMIYSTVVMPSSTFVQPSSRMSLKPFLGATSTINGEPGNLFDRHQPRTLLPLTKRYRNDASPDIGAPHRQIAPAGRHIQSPRRKPWVTSAPHQRPAPAGQRRELCKRIGHPIAFGSLFRLPCLP